MDNSMSLNWSLNSEQPIQTWVNASMNDNHHHSNNDSYSNTNNSNNNDNDDDDKGEIINMKISLRTKNILKSK